MPPAAGDLPKPCRLSPPAAGTIANPLLAAAEAQEKLASVAWDFYQKIAYEEDHKTTRLLKFELNRPVVEGGVVSKKGMEQKVEAPFIGLVPIPSLLIDRVNVGISGKVSILKNEGVSKRR